MPVRNAMGLVIQSSKVRPPRIIKRKLHAVIDKLYRAIIREFGIYARGLSHIDTHAPERFLYPGSPALYKSTRETTQGGLFDEDVLVEMVDTPTTLEPQTLKHRRWLWFATLTDRREISVRVYAAHCRIYEDHPDFYEGAAGDIEPAEFSTAILNGKYKIGSPGQSANYWQICSQTLFKEFGGDPVKLLTHAGWSVEKVFAWKQQQKKSVANGGRGYDPVLVAQATWLLGSTLCVKCSGRTEAQGLCPIYLDYKGRIDTSHYLTNGKWPKVSSYMKKGGERAAYGFPAGHEVRRKRRGEIVIPIRSLFDT